MHVQIAPYWNHVYEQDFCIYFPTYRTSTAHDAHFPKPVPALILFMTAPVQHIRLRRVLLVLSCHAKCLCTRFGIIRGQGRLGPRPGPVMGRHVGTRGCKTRFRIRTRLLVTSEGVFVWARDEGVVGVGLGAVRGGGGSFAREYLCDCGVSFTDDFVLSIFLFRLVLKKRWIANFGWLGIVVRFVLF